MESPWLEWVRTFGLSISKLDDLVDDQNLSELLHSIDSEAFRYDGGQQKSTNNWVLRFNGLKRLYKTLCQFLVVRGIEIHQDVQGPNLSSIAKERSIPELIKILNLIVLASVMCDRRDEFLSRMFNLSVESRKILVGSIEKSKLPEDASHAIKLHGLSAQISITSDNTTKALSCMSIEDRDLSQKCESLERRCRALTDDQRKLAEENVVLRMQLNISEAPNDSLHSDGHANEIQQLNRQYQELQNQFLVTEDHLAEKVAESTDQIERIVQLEKALAAASTSVDVSALSKLQEEIAEFEYMAESHRKLEIVNEKYKKKLTQSATDLAILAERISQLEEQNKALEAQSEGTKLLKVKLDDAQHIIRCLQAASTDSATIQMAEPMSLFTSEFVSEEPDKESTDTSAQGHQSSRTSRLPNAHVIVPQESVEQSNDNSAAASQSSPPVAAQNIEDLQQALLMKQEEISHHLELQMKTKRLLKKQDALIKTYQQRLDEQEIHHERLSSTADLASKERQFAAYRKEAEEREARLKQENTLVAKAFYDLAARLSSSSLSLQRSSTTPKSFLGSRRLALGVLAPKSSHH